MSTATDRYAATIERFFPLILVAVIVGIGYFWYLQPGVSEYMRGRQQVISLELQVRSLQDTILRGRSLPPSDQRAVTAEFERLFARDDRVPEVAERMARVALDVSPRDRIRGLLIESGDRSNRTSSGTTRTAFSAGQMGSEQGDLRLLLFPARITQTPVVVSFESTFDAIAGFAWRLRDLPTMTEVHSITLTRGLPLMKAEFRLLVFQRGAATVLAEPQPDQAAPNGSTTPRVSPLVGAGE